MQGFIDFWLGSLPSACKRDFFRYDDCILQLVGRIQAPILLMMGFVPLFIRFRTAVDRVQELEQVEVEQEIEQEYITEPQNIEINQLSFRYDDKLVIKDLSAKFITGQPVAIIGSSGKGKTTLIRLLLALIKPDKGEIFINTLQNI